MKANLTYYVKFRKQQRQLNLKEITNLRINKELWNTYNCIHLKKVTLNGIKL